MATLTFWWLPTTVPPIFTATTEGTGITGCKFDLTGTKSNRDGIGAVVKAGNQSQMVHSGSSYCSASDLALTFGLGSETSTSIEIQWPSGVHQKMNNVKADQSITVQEQ